MAFLDSIFDPTLGKLLELGPFWALLILSLIISLLIILVYKYFTNQVEMKRLKEQQKEFQQKMKSLKSNPEELMKIQKEAMGVNMQYMKHSLKATLITMLPVILIFGWMNGHLANEPIFPNEA
ncbi:MAG: EMC3/TMCO1 family protein, partial [Nanoarchaeota archaeon]|nr:EMC3/TMCO1 family protein [Nanoarchaeota archaeon]